MEARRDKTHYPARPAKASVAIRHRAATRAHAIADRIQTARKAPELRDLDDETLGIKSARKVARWTASRETSDGGQRMRTHTSSNKAQRNPTKTSLDPEDVLQDDFSVLDLGRLWRTKGIITGGEGASAIERKKGSGECEEER